MFPRQPIMELWNTDLKDCPPSLSPGTNMLTISYRSPNKKPRESSMPTICSNVISWKMILSTQLKLNLHNNLSQQQQQPSLCKIQEVARKRSN